MAGAVSGADGPLVSVRGACLLALKNFRRRDEPAGGKTLVRHLSLCLT
jgi:hypothetical protein